MSGGRVARERGSHGLTSGHRKRKDGIPMLTEYCDKHAAVAYTAGGENPMVGFARGAEDVTDERMREIAARMREAATKVGTTSTLWDVVFDAEAILTGEVSWADRKTVERSLEEWARRWDWDQVA